MMPVITMRVLLQQPWIQVNETLTTGTQRRAGDQLSGDRLRHATTCNAVVIAADLAPKTKVSIWKIVASGATIRWDASSRSASKSMSRSTAPTSSAAHTAHQYELARSGQVHPHVRTPPAALAAAAAHRPGVEAERLRTHRPHVDER